MWKSISSAIMTIVEAAHFEASPEGVAFRSMDPPHIALIDVNWPSSAFEKFHCPSVIKFGIRIDDFSKVIKRAGTNDSIEINVQDNYLNIITSGDYLRNYKMRLIESEASSVSSLLQMTFDSKIAQGYHRILGYMDTALIRGTNYQMTRITTVVIFLVPITITFIVTLATCDYYYCINSFFLCNTARKLSNHRTFTGYSNNNRGGCRV
jgi:Proliferating cell nuclear antigen, N-terminal domain